MHLDITVWDFVFALVEALAFLVFAGMLDGLTKREYFAAAALIGWQFGHDITSSYSYSQIAEEAVSIADAMLVELSKPREI